MDQATSKDLEALEASLLRMNGDLKRLLQFLDYYMKEKRSNEQFYALTSDPVTLGAGINTVGNDNVINQGSDADFVCTDMTKFSDGVFKFNFGILGAKWFYFTKQIRSDAFFLGTVVYRLARSIGIPRATGITWDGTNLQAAANNVQLVFLGYKVWPL